MAFLTKLIFFLSMLQRGVISDIAIKGAAAELVVLFMVIGLNNPAY